MYFAFYLTDEDGTYCSKRFQVNCAVLHGSLIPTFWVNLSAPSSRVKLGPWRWNRKIPEQRSSPLNRSWSPKSL